MLVNRQDAKGAKTEGRGTEGNKGSEEAGLQTAQTQTDAPEEGIVGCIWRYGALLGAGLLAVEEAGLVFFVSTKDCNHWGYDTRYGLAPPVLVAAWLVLGVCAARSKWSIIGGCLVLCIVVGLTVVVCDSFNLLVEYERWCQRGLPDPWKTTPCAE